MFFRVLAAIVTADAFDRHMREQQRCAWGAEEARRQAAASALPPAPGAGVPTAPGGAWDSRAPERPA